jgi:two-component system cell cycle sensor histidine kinase/response regulator CckA
VLLEPPATDLLRHSLHRSEARFRAMFEQSAVGMAIADREGTLIRVNDPFAKMLGYEPWELVGHSFLEITHPQDRYRAFRLLLSADAVKQQQVTYEKRYLRKDGSTAWVRATVSRLRDEAGEEDGYTAVVEDITPARLASEALEEQVDITSSILDAMPLMISIWMDAKPLYVNHEWRRLMGYSLTEARAIDVLAVTLPEANEAERARRSVTSNPMEWQEFEPVARDGTRILSSWATMRLPDGSMLRVGQDIREQRRLLTQYAQAQKMEALGQLAAGVAHDFNNLLTVIGACVSFLKTETAGNASAAQDIDEIRKSADRAASLTRQMLAFSRQQVMHPEVVDVNEQVAIAVKTLKRLIGENIELALVPAAERPLVEVDAHQLDQVLMNLVVNARDAIAEQGTVTVGTENRMWTEPGGSQREYLALTVTDDGCGIPPAIRDQIFNPFFTTKPLGQGTGLGLATVHGIISQSGGQMEVESEVGRGTTFTILLPTVAERPIAVSNVRLRRAATPQETILLVEDETALRAAARRMLAGAGYRILEARHGEDALEVLAQEGAVDILVTDVVMPQMGGRDLADQVRLQFPGTPVLFLTGYTDDELLRRGALEEDARVLRKPFQAAELIGAVADLLNRTTR